MTTPTLRAAAQAALDALDTSPRISTGSKLHDMLRAALAQRGPLTKEEAITLWSDRSDGPDNHEIVSYCRAVERAHGIE